MLKRYWAVSIALVLLIAAVFADGISRMGLALTSIALLLYAWLTLRRFWKTWQSFTLFTLALLLPALAALWGALNVIRANTYDGDSPNIVYYRVCQIQAGMEWCAWGIAVGLVVMGIVAGVRTLRRTTSASNSSV